MGISVQQYGSVPNKEVDLYSEVLMHEGQSQGMVPRVELCPGQNREKVCFLKRL